MSSMLLESHQNSSSDFFEAAFQDGPAKTSCIAVTLISMLVLIPAGYGIVWYEKFGSDKKRILVNRLLTSLCWTSTELYVVVIPLDIMRYLYGPLSIKVCYFHVIIKNVLNVQTVLFIDGVIFARYLFVFYLKNPFDFKDDFWHMFINIWVMAVSFVSQFIFVLMPGKQPMNFYLCTGQVRHFWFLTQ